MATQETDTKQILHAEIDRLPDGVTVGEALYTLYVRASFHAGLEDIERNGGIPHDEVMASLKKWLD